MKKTMIKALACGLAFTLALSTPVAVSAEGLSDIYTTSEKSENDTSSNTSTNTDTNSNAEVIDEETYAKVIGIVLDKEAATVEAGKTLTLEATILIDNNANKDTNAFSSMSVAELQAAGDMIVVFEDKEVKASELVTMLKWYEDSEEKIVDVTDNNDGTATVVGITKGNTKVSVQLGDVYKATADVKVKVYAKEIKLTAPEHAYVKHVYDMNANLTSDGNDDVTWRVYEIKDGRQKKTSAATITKDGKLTVKSAKKSIRVKVVTEKGVSTFVDFTTEEGNPIKKLKKESDNLTLEFVSDNNYANPTGTLEVSYESKYSDKVNTDDITWTSKKPNIATVEENGEKVTVTGHNPGKTTITAKSTSGKKVTFKVTVKSELQSIDKIESAKEHIYNGQSVQLTAVKTPANASGTVKFKIKNKKEKKIATVSAKGVLKANKTGKTGTVTVTAYCNNKTCDQTFLIEEGKITGINITNPSANERGKYNLVLYKNKSFAVEADFFDKDNLKVDPDMAIWASNKAKVATVDDDGVIKAMAAGKANITVSGVAGNKTVSKKIAVTVKQPVTQIQLAKTDITVNPKTTNQKVTLKVSKQLPKGCTKEEITWNVIEGDYSLNKTTGTSVKLTIPADTKAGTVIKVQATAASGAKAIATITLCNKTSKVEMVGADGNKATTLNVGESLDLDGLAKVTANVGGDKVVSIGEADAKAKNNEVVLSYTSNKSCVRIVDGTVYAVEPGKATITAKLASGKKATFKVTVVDNN